MEIHFKASKINKKRDSEQLKIIVWKKIVDLLAH